MSSESDRHDAPETSSAPDERAGAWRRVRRRLTPLLAAVGALVVVLLLAAALYRLLAGGPGVPDGTVLELDLERDYPEHVPNELVARQMQGTETTVRDVVGALQRAAGDDRVRGLVAKVGATPMGLARIQEIRDAVLAFRESGKPAVAWAETFAEFGPANGGYYLATAFDEIRMQPSGSVGVTGLLAEAQFLTRALDKIGVRMRGDHRYEFKNAYNTFVDTAFTAAHREAVSAVMEAQFGQIVRGVAEGRRLDTAAVRDLFDRGPFLGAEAVEAGLVDGLAYRDEVYGALEERVGGAFTPLYLPTYLARAGGPHREGATVALVHGVGPVMRGASGFEPAFWSPSMGSETVTAAFRAAVADEDVEAILFRVASPGGSYVASDAIWREVVRAREAGRPVVVSMGDVAGSGGYFVAMPADRIVAQPATVTGSIGVLNVKPLTGELWQKLGIDFDDVQTSDHAEMWSTRHDFDPGEWERFQAWLDRVYEDFTRKAARGRELPLDSLQSVARGRIWAGEDALRIGLVDELGGYPAALAAVREAAGLAPDAPVKLKIYPRPLTWWDRIFGDEPAGSRDEARERLGTLLRPLLRAGRASGLLEPAGVLTTPEVTPR